MLDLRTTVSVPLFFFSACGRGCGLYTSAVDGISTQRRDTARLWAQNDEVARPGEIDMRPPLLASAFASGLIAILAPAADAASFVRPAGGAPSAAMSPFPPPGLAPVIVNSSLGGQIFGFDIDHDGTEGMLSEAQTQDRWHMIAAVETFDQRTGEILRVVTRRTNAATISSRSASSGITSGSSSTSTGRVSRHRSHVPDARSARVEPVHAALAAADRCPSPDRAVSRNHGHRTRSSRTPTTTARTSGRRCSARTSRRQRSDR